jgi:hypothetical protein
MGWWFAVNSFSPISRTGRTVNGETRGYLDNLYRLKQAHLMKRAWNRCIRIDGYTAFMFADFFGHNFMMFQQFPGSITVFADSDIQLDFVRGKNRRTKFYIAKNLFVERAERNEIKVLWVNENQEVPPMWFFGDDNG